MSRIILVDTSAILRLILPSDQGAEVESSIDDLRRQGADLHVLVHTLRECWAVLTRSVAANGGGGLESAQARREIEDLDRTFLRLEDPPEAYNLWLDLCTAQNIRGLLCHDAYLAACALALDVPIYALDRDFVRFGVRTP